MQLKAIAETSAVPTGLTEANKPAFMDVSEKLDVGYNYIETDRVVTSGIVNWISHMGSFNYGYANFSGGKQINKMLFESISETDVRKGWWTDADGVSANLTKEQQATIDSYGYNPYTQVKLLLIRM